MDTPVPQCRPYTTHRIHRYVSGGVWRKQAEMGRRGVWRELSFEREGSGLSVRKVTPRARERIGMR